MTVAHALRRPCVGLKIRPTAAALPTIFKTAFSQVDSLSRFRLWAIPTVTVTVTA